MRLSVSSRLTILLLGSVACSFIEGTAVHVPPSSNSQEAPKQKNNNAAVIAPRGGSVETTKLLRLIAADEGHMPCLFLPEEATYDRYAACLAATEGLRRIRDRDLSDAAKQRGTIGGLSGTQLTEGEKHINEEYVSNAGKVLRALGMSVSQFNQLGKQISQDEKLRDRVMEQAYLYRMAATINMDRMPLLQQEQTTAELLQSFQRDKIKMFCESMSEIEQLREAQIGRLKRSLHVDEFPAVNISDPILLPFLSPKVRAVVEAFPLQAEDIVRKHGLESEEFNKMLSETKANPIFRWKIQKQMRTGQAGQRPSQKKTGMNRGGSFGFGRN